MSRLSRPVVETLENRLQYAVIGGPEPLLPRREYLPDENDVRMTKAFGAYDLRAIYVTPDGTLHLSGTDRADTFTFTESGGRRSVRVVVPLGGSHEPAALTVGWDGGMTSTQAIPTLPDGTSVLTSTITYLGDQLKAVQFEENGSAGDVAVLADGRVVKAKGVLSGATVWKTTPRSTPWRSASGVTAGSAEAWAEKAKSIKDAADESRASVAFLGDSHMERYRYYGRHSWNAHFAGGLNLGLSGDGTRQLLARIRDGLFDDYRPDKIVLMFGTNNLNDPGESADAEIARGMKAVIAELRQRLPETQLVLLSILPRNDDVRNARVQTLNRYAARLSDGKHVFFADVFDRFNGPERQASLFLPDHSHLNARGYRVLTEALLDFFEQERWR